MRKLMKPLLLSVGLVVCPTLAFCQQPVPATLSLADAIALARQHNPAYQQTIHDRSPAAWGVRNAWSSLWLPSVTASGGVAYAGPGEQNFLTSSFSQSVSTWSSNYNFFLDWTLNGQTLSQPGLKKAELNAAQADVVGAETNLVTAVRQQYLTVLQARDNAEVAQQQLQHDEQFLKLAQARYDVGRASLIDVRQAAPVRRRTRPRAHTRTAPGSTPGPGSRCSTARSTPSVPARSRRSATRTAAIPSISPRSRSRRGSPSRSPCGAIFTNRCWFRRPRPSSRTSRNRCGRAGSKCRPT